ncbi:MAG: tRNA 2-thiouridine(34) synthase MnmA, partial [Deltaproteobacteria bacterium]|nr:tRNA 2-thiouridine(34) synthase MnmA [Deltaproteobacteria bacterium]
EKNTVTVGFERELYSSWARINDINLISVERLDKPIEAWVKIRYRQAESAALVTPVGNGELSIEFRSPQKAVALGQAAVLYQGDTVVGGGTIIAAG